MAEQMVSGFGGLLRRVRAEAGLTQEELAEAAALSPRSVYDQCLLTEPAAGRYRMHDLLRAHARALGGRLDTGRDREEATGRLLDYYEHTAARASALITRLTRPGPPCAVGAVPAAVPGLAGQEQALAWLRAERASLLACLDHATATGQHARITALTAAVAGLLRSDGPWTEAIIRHTTAATAARQLGDRLAQANALNDLGHLRRMTSDYPDAVQVLEQALGIYRDIGDRLGQANVLSYLGSFGTMTGDYPAAAQAHTVALDLYRDLGDRVGQADALRELGAVRFNMGDSPAAIQLVEQALGIFRDIGDRHGQAEALSYLGGIRRRTGDYPAATQVLDHALSIFRELGDRAGEPEALNEIGTLHRVSGDLAQAKGCHQQALEQARAIASPSTEARALAGLGRCALAVGHTDEAADMLREALEIFQRIGDAEAADVSADLDATATFNVTANGTQPRP